MKQNVLVIGAGVSGLTSAMCLLNAGFKVTVLADKSAAETASTVAGALWEWPPAVCGHHTDALSLSRSKKWAEVSYRRFDQIAMRAEAGVRMIRAVFYFRQPVNDAPHERQKMDETRNHVKAFEHSCDLIDRFGVNRNVGIVDAYSYVAPIIDTGVYMDWLHDQVVAKGCQRVQCKLTHPLTEIEQALRDEYDAVAIVNCAGLGSIELVGDTMQPLRGALIRVKNDGVKMPRIDIARCLAHDDTVTDQQMIYIIPRAPDRLLLGGIAEIGEWDTTITLDNYVPIRHILDRCREFMPVLNSAEIDEADPLRVGLRPYRERNVRLDCEPSRPVIHNYGHGGSGFTFSWGCAEEVVELVRSIA